MSKDEDIKEVVEADEESGITEERADQINEFIAMMAKGREDADDMIDLLHHVLADIFEALEWDWHDCANFYASGVLACAEMAGHNMTVAFGDGSSITVRSSENPDEPGMVDVDAATGEIVAAEDSEVVYSADEEQETGVYRDPESGKVKLH